MNVRSSRHGKLGLKVGLTVGAPTAHPAAHYWELWDDDIPTTSHASTKARPWS